MLELWRKVQQIVENNLAVIHKNLWLKTVAEQGNVYIFCVPINV